MPFLCISFLHKPFFLQVNNMCIVKFLYCMSKFVECTHRQTLCFISHNTSHVHLNSLVSFISKARVSGMEWRSCKMARVEEWKWKRESCVCCRYVSLKIAFSIIIKYWSTEQLMSLAFFLAFESSVVKKSYNTRV